MALDKVIDSAQLDADLTAVADAIRTKGGTTGELEFPSGFVSAVEGIQAGGGDADPNAIARSIVDKSITEYVDTEIAEIGQYAFYYCSDLVSANLPSVTNIGKAGFAYSGLVEIEMPNLTKCSADVFGNCKSLVSVKLPKISTLWGVNGLFAGCTALKYVHVPNIVEVGQSFDGCSALEEIELPSMNGRIASNAFRNCSMLQKIDFGGYLNIAGSSTFLNCGKLNTLILRGTSVSPLSNLNNFTGTPFAEGNTGGVLLAPSALVESYKTATNWSVLYGYGTNRFLTLEDYTVNGTITGEIDWDKVNALFEEASA